MHLQRSDISSEAMSLRQRSIDLLKEYSEPQAEYPILKMKDNLQETALA